MAVQRKSGAGAAAIYETTDAEELAEMLAVAFGWGILRDFEACLRYLQSAAKSLGDGALTRAHISLAFMNLPKLTPDAADRLRQLEAMRKSNPTVATESRDWRGRWTADGDGGSQVQVADTQTTVQSDAPDPSAGIRDPHIVTLRDGSVVTDYQGNPMKKPPDVSLDENAKLGQFLAGLPSGVRDGLMLELFRPGGLMDYQRIYPTANGKPNPDYVDFGNYNYGIVAAAAGYGRKEAEILAGLANLGLGHGDTSGPWWNKQRNLPMLLKGYDDYQTGKVSVAD